MALRSLACCMVLGLVMVVALAPSAVEGSSRRLIDQKNGAVAAAAQGGGVCESLVTVHGYKCQEIFVTTADGYILNVQRIPAGRNGGGGAGKPPVIIQHGVLVDAATWLLNSPDKNLPLILADDGYDVWMANTRGTRFSRRHTTMDARDPKFWDWSFDELVADDLPAVFNYVHGKTKQKINYIGHSLGTLLALASLSEGKLVDQLKSVALLSPVAYLNFMSTPLGAVGARIFAGEITRLLGFAEFDPKSGPVSDMIDDLCASAGVHCYNLLAVLTGPNCCLNSSTVDLFLAYEPQSTSTKTLMHLSQIVRSGVVAKYDYGRLDKNFLHYRSFSPPHYDLSKIPRNMPMFISFGGHDALSDELDVMSLLDHLKFHDKGKLVVNFIHEYAHADFVMGVNAKDLVYNKVISFFKQQQ
ncbi:triacylglycerol lipase 2 [Argentina anserina]|uniref:triacylglycerol lipase 2 n=1 Tax=Argentina anserina TaxID=57926 RepID=UPI0021765ACE|nr:triacylglycerol lipase 2 [Potentilla anserina]